MIAKIFPFVIAAGFLLAAVPSGADYEYIGAAKCKICHNKPEKGEQYKKWSTSKHAQAMKSLKGDELNNPKCLKCHSTAVANQKFADTITREEGVSCESCHGPGSAYKLPTIMKDKAKALANGMIEPTEKVCKTCHNDESPTFKGFDFKTYSAKIAHPAPKGN
jgi:cytochrome c5